MGTPAAGLIGTARRYWLPVFLGGCAIALLPWTIVVNAALPSRAIVSHWDTAWTGFDIALGAVLLSTALAARRNAPAAAKLATAGATLLICDAWFDILTAATSAERLTAMIEAAVAELPLAALCLAIARDPSRFTASVASARSAVPAAPVAPDTR